jgi:hypothetical protein
MRDVDLGGTAGAAREADALPGVMRSSLSIATSRANALVART